MKPPKDGTKIFVLYDGRAHSDIDSAQVMVCAHSEEECKSVGNDYGNDCLWVEYVIQNGVGEEVAVRYDLS